MMHAGASDHPLLRNFVSTFFLLEKMQGIPPLHHISIGLNFLTKIWLKQCLQIGTFYYKNCDPHAVFGPKTLFPP